MKASLINIRVRVPSVSEIEAIYNYFKNPNLEKIEAEYQLMAKAFENLEGKEGVEVKDNDFIIDGRSIREAATNKHILQHRIVEYIKFLIPETGSLEDITYEDVEAEFPLSVQMTLVEKINEVISPDYKDIKSK